MPLHKTEEQMYTAHIDEVMQGMYKLLSDFQGEKPGVQLAAYGVAFLMGCKRYDVEPRNVLEASARYINEAIDKNHVNYMAARDTMTELLG